jgi:hypothetical protein
MPLTQIGDIALHAAEQIPNTLNRADFRLSVQILFQSRANYFRSFAF